MSLHRCSGLQVIEWMLLFLHSKLDWIRTPSFLKKLRRRKAKCDNIGEEDGDEHPSPGDHVCHFGVDIIALVLVCEWEV